MGSRPRRRAREQFLDKLPKLEQQWLHDLVPWGQDASQNEFTSAVRRWWAKADAAEIFGEDFKNATGTLGMISRVGRLADAPIAIAVDVSTLFNPAQSGRPAWRTG